MSFKYFMPTEVFSYEGCIADNAEKISHFGKRCVLVTGQISAKKSGALDDVISVLDRHGIEYGIFDEIEPNPLVSTCYRAGQFAASMSADFVIGIGGGSPLDAAKAVAVYGANPNLTAGCLYEGWENSALPIVLVGTTAGTGSEVTPYSVLTLDETGQKKSWSSTEAFAKLAFGDPRHMRSLPSNFTVSTALDALSHCVESYYIESGDIISQNFSLAGLRLGLCTLDSIKDFNDISLSQRSDLYTASIYGGLAINTTGTTFCHLLSYPLSEQMDIPHGFACAVFLPEFIKVAGASDPIKTKRLKEFLGIDSDTLADKIKKLTPDVKITSKDSFECWLKRWENHPNARKTKIDARPELIKEMALRSLQVGF